MRSTPRWSALLLTLAVASPAAAQSLWPTPLKGRGEIGLEWVRPTFVDGDDQFGFSRGIWILSGRIRASEKINVVLALPQMRAPGGGGFGDETSIGNLYAGVEFLQKERRPEFSLGIRFGGSAGDGFGPAGMALYGDFDRWEEALPETWIINMAGHFIPWQDSAGASVRVRFGGTVLRPQETGASGELYVDYGIRFGRDTPALRLGAALTGRWAATSGGGASIAETTIHQVTGELSFGAGSVQPSIGLRIPLDEALDQTVKYVLIGGVTVALR